jgi:rhamnose transport system ATP-binding protein
MKNDGSQARLSVRKISKSYVGIRALRDIDFEIAAGEIHALVGENGAGKSTLVKVITGLESADSGQLLLDGVECRFHDPMEARGNGVLAVYQDPKLFPNLDIAENVFMGIHPKTKVGFIDRKLMYRRTREVLDRLGADLDPRTMVMSLSTGQMLFVEFARALFEAREKLLLLDEPTASLSPGETEKLFEIMKKLRDSGVSIVFISHRIEELFGFADTITILRDGSHVVTTEMRNMTQGQIVQHMVGREISNLYSPAKAETRPATSPHADGDPVLRVEGLESRGEFHDVSFEVYPGEIVGMAGLVGSGRTEIAKGLFGALPLTGGTVWIDNRKVTVRKPSQMINAGVVYVPEDREIEGLVAELSVNDNMLLPSVVKLSTNGFINTREEARIYEQYTSQFQIKCPGPKTRISGLSGGNRQKVVLSKWMATRPKVFIFDEPTHGIDIGSKAQVHKVIREIAKQGVGILLISSDLPEVLAMSDRVLVVSEGSLAAEFDRTSATQENIMAAALTGRNARKT